MRSVECEGDSIDEAIAKALGTLQVERDRVEIEILADATRGLWGFGGRKARVRATLRPPVRALPDVSREAFDAATGEAPVSTPSGATRARALVEEILGHLGASCTVAIHEAAEPGSILLAVSGEGSGLIIGRRGQTLDALEYLVNRVIGRDGEGQGGRIVVDVERYRERRREALEQLARRLAEKAKLSGRVVTLNPMSPRDRRIVHLTLQGDSGVATRSQGSGHYRKVLLIPSSSSGRRPER
ncbi:MAG: KH domain-containing protein [Deltaproteobacteria bacterium]|nr:MAG: KH domain-containing protein [Deltaproteobacteria bacterium]TMB03673.1 MAG: KH domain-containing protein [Deltaproteobacteria bacterium]